MTDRADTDLSRALRAARESSGLRQLDVAGPGKVVSQARLSRIENGQSLPTEAEVRQLTTLYGASTDDVERIVALAAAARWRARRRRAPAWAVSTAKALTTSS